MKEMQIQNTSLLDFNFRTKMAANIIQWRWANLKQINRWVKDIYIAHMFISDTYNGGNYAKYIRFRNVGNADFSVYC